MDNLTTREVSVLNDVSNERSPSVDLGTKLQTLVTILPSVGTPINAVAASKLLTLTGVVIDSETVTIGSDVYEFLTDTAQTKSAQSNIAVDIEAFTGKATVNLTVVTQPTAGDTMTIGSKVFTFVPIETTPVDGEISVGADLAEAQSNIIEAVNGGDDYSVSHPLVSANVFNADVCPITALIGGTVSNGIVSTETFTAVGNVFSAATLTGGTNCSAANADGALLDAVTDFGFEAVSATQGTGTTVLFTSDIAGVIGNDMIIDESLANGSFAGGATALSGGIDGTVGVVGQMYVDDSYLYICVSDNDASDTNWRRVSVGAVY